MGGVVDAIGRDLRLEDRRHRHRLVRHLRPAMIELRCVQTRKLHHRHVYTGLLVQQLRPNRFEEPFHRMLRAAIRSLERDAPVCEGRADLDDRSAVARQHPLERRLCSPDGAEIGDIGRPLELFGLDVLEKREHGGHCVVDPDIDLSERFLGGRCCCFDRVRAGHVGRQRQRSAAEPLDGLGGFVETLASAREQRDLCSLPREPLDNRTADAACRPRDHDNLTPAHSTAPPCRPRRSLRPR